MLYMKVFSFVHKRFISYGNGKKSTLIDKKTVMERRNAVIEEADPRTDAETLSCSFLSTQKYRNS